MSLFGLPFLRFAPNRLLTGEGLSWWQAPLGPGHWACVLPLGWLLSARWPGNRFARGADMLVAVLWLLLLPWLAGTTARQWVPDADSLARVSLGAGFWLSWGLAALLLSERLREAGWPLWRRGLIWGATILLLVGEGLVGALDDLSLLREYGNHQDAFELAFGQHIRLVVFSVLPAVVLGALLGMAAARHNRLQGPLFAVLNLIQTLPSIALFGLLLAPLAWLGERLPASGIAGIGMAPALLALMLYSLLPITRGTLAGLQQVPAAAVDAARGMGMSPRQILWRVELPLALPVFLAGVRITAVQAVGLAVVAALIGAGGFGTIMFQGLSGSALDLVLLGVIPVVAMAIAVDLLFKLISAGVARHD